jgi:hypothetical protein
MKRTSTPFRSITKHLSVLLFYSFIQLSQLLRTACHSPLGLFGSRLFLFLKNTLWRIILIELASNQELANIRVCLACSQHLPHQKIGKPTIFGSCLEWSPQIGSPKFAPGCPCDFRPREGALKAHKSIAKILVAPSARFFPVGSL